MKRYGDQAKAVAKERVYLGRIEGKQNLQRAAVLLKLFTDDTIAAETPFSEVRARAFGILESRSANRSGSIRRRPFRWSSYPRPPGATSTPGAVTGNSCCRIATSFSSTLSCPTGSKPESSSVATACVSAVSKTI
ncbi:MAG: hypothetical protein IH820_18115 [Bacteroidetes bacterium]|nr:hypothetical protein [Bacteroidota bacterium]